MGIFDYASQILTPLQHQRLLKESLLEEIAKVGIQEANLLLNSFSYHFRLSFSSEIQRRLRNDKYYFLLNQKSRGFHTTDLEAVYFSSRLVLSLKEKTDLQLLKMIHARRV
jgi:hypothetical protein